MPVQHHVSSAASVSHRVTCWKQLTPFSEIYSEVRERLISSSTIDNCASNNIFWSTWANGWTERLNLTKNVWILVKSSLSERSKVIEGTLLIKWMLEYELIWSALQLVLSINHLILVRLHRSDGTSWRLQCHAWSTLSRNENIFLRLQCLEWIHLLTLTECVHELLVLRLIRKHLLNTILKRWCNHLSRHVLRRNFFFLKFFSIVADWHGHAQMRIWMIRIA